jgi:tartrate dehydrogenase/decarboxylase/D-malate dehydrogenase
VAPSGNINPTGKWPSLFEPVHGSAPDIAGKGIANPIGMIWAGQMMLGHFGHAEAAAVMMKAIEETLEHAGSSVITPDLGGKGTCEALGKHIANLIDTI